MVCHECVIDGAVHRQSRIVSGRNDAVLERGGTNAQRREEMGKRWVSLHHRVTRLRLDRKVFRRKIPVDRFVEHRVDVICAAILIIQVISVLPHIDGQKRLLSSRERGVRVAGFCDRELVTVLNQPRPATTELCRRRGEPFLVKRIQAAKRLVDFMAQRD